MLTLSTLCLSALLAQGQPNAASHTQAISPYLDELTVAVARLNLEKVDAKALGDILKEGGMDAGHTMLVQTFAEMGAAQLREAGAKEVFVVYSLADLLEGPFIVVPLPGKESAKAVEETLARAKMRVADDWGTITALGDGKAIAMARKRTVERLRALKPMPRPELAKAFAAAGDVMLQLAVFPTPDTRRILEELQPSFPAELGGGPITALTRGALWASLGVDLKPAARVRLVIQSENADAAAALRQVIRAGLGLAAQQRMVRNLVKDQQEVQQLLTPAVAGDQLVLTLDQRNQGLPKLLSQLVPAVRTSVAQRGSAESLKTLVLALHDYHDDHGAFPLDAIRSKDGKPLLSWRVRLLPYLGQVKLYKEFRLEEPWDSEHNKKLIARMPGVLRSAITKKQDPGLTRFLAPLHAESIWPGDKAIKIGDIFDGTVSTIALVEADESHAVVWTKPEDLKLDLNDPLKGLAGAQPDGFFAGMADGSVHFLRPDKIDKATFRALFTRGGGEAVTLP